LRSDVVVERYEHDSIVRAIATGLLRNVNILNTLAPHYADLIRCVSRRQYEILTSILPEVKPKTTVIYNPLLSSLPREAKSKEPTIVYPSSSSYVKGFHTVLACLHETAKRKLNIQY